MENNQQNRGSQGQDESLQRDQQSESNKLDQQNNESLNTSSRQPVQNLRDKAVGSGRSYDYGSQNSPEQDQERESGGR